MKIRNVSRSTRATITGMLVVFSMAACGGAQQQSDRDLDKALEGAATASLASFFSDYCNSVFDKGLWIQRTRIEFRREIRQSTAGRYGPRPPSRPIPGLDSRTAEGTGPVVRIWCQGDEVPEVIWREMVRDWRD